MMLLEPVYFFIFLSSLLLARSLALDCYFYYATCNFIIIYKLFFSLIFQVLEEDLLPKNICATCFLKIESIDKFAYSAAKNQECFLTWIQNSKNAKLDQNVTQTTIETSTNSDFSFCNITIKKEFNQRQQIIFQPQKSRNARHVDHVTLEQIINDQIIKNPKLPASTTITKIDEPKRPRSQQQPPPPPTQQQQQRNENSNNISIVSYNNIQIGQVIKDYEFLKLILRALKWEEYDRKTSYHELMERLKRSYCRDILTNKNLLSDNDVVQLLRSTLNDSVLSNLKMTTTPPSSTTVASKVFIPQSVIVAAPASTSSSVPSRVTKVSYVPPSSSSSSDNSNKTTTIVQNEEAMEVSIDPDMMYIDETVMIDDDDDDEEETNSAMEAKIETAKLVESVNTRNNGNYICSSCPQQFTSSTELQNHVTNHLITSPSSTTSTPTSSSSSKEVHDNNNETTSKTPTKSAIEIVEKTPKKKKIVKEEEHNNARPKRKSFVLKINPSPVKLKRQIRERAKPQQSSTTSTQFTCSICTKSLSSKRNLQLHIETHKNRSGKFLCDIEGCRKFFGKMENVVKHKLEAHEKSTKRKRNQNEK